MLNRDAIMNKVDIKEKLTLFSGHWNPRIAGELNGQHVRLVKFQGEFIWHKHDAAYLWLYKKITMR